MTPLDWITPVEAKRKWCPKSITSKGGQAVNRLDGKSCETIPAKCKCLAECCAHWEWQTNEHKHGRCSDG